MKPRRADEAPRPVLRVVRAEAAEDAAPAAAALAAGRAALAAHRWHEARRAFAEALAEADSPEAHEGLADAAAALGEGNEARRQRENAYRGYRERGDVRSAARAATRLGADSADFWDEPAVGHGWLQRADRLLADLPPTAELAWLRVWQAHVALVCDYDVAEATRLAIEAAELGGRLGLPAVQMFSQAQLGMARVLAGRAAEGFVLLDEAAAAATGGELADADAAGASTCYVLHACEYVLDYSRALQWVRRAEDFIRPQDLSPVLAFCHEHFCRAQVWRGEWQEAEQELQRLAVAFPAWAPSYAVSARRQLAELRLRRGMFEEALALLGDDPGAESHALRAAVTLEQGRVEQAIELAERALRHVGPGERLRRSRALAVLARALAERGDLVAARSALDELAEVAATAGTAGMAALCNAVTGDVALAAGDLAAARRAYEDAGDLYRQSGAPYEAACSRAGLAACLAAAGRREEAVAEARQAVDALRGLGAVARVAVTAERLLAEASPSGAVATGGAATSAVATGPLAALSERELQVLAEVAAGRSNEEIARRLHLSVHTVKRHVANLLAKLDLPSRTAAASLAVRCGVEPPA